MAFLYIQVYVVKHTSFGLPFVPYFQKGGTCRFAPSCSLALQTIHSPNIHPYCCEYCRVVISMLNSGVEFLCKPFGLWMVWWSCSIPNIIFQLGLNIDDKFLTLRERERESERERGGERQRGKEGGWRRDGGREERDEENKKSDKTHKMCWSMYIMYIYDNT